MRQFLFGLKALNTLSRNDRLTDTEIANLHFIHTGWRPSPRTVEAHRRTLGIRKYPREQLIPTTRPRRPREAWILIQKAIKLVERGQVPSMRALRRAGAPVRVLFRKSFANHNNFNNTRPGVLERLIVIALVKRWRAGKLGPYGKDFLRRKLVSRYRRNLKDQLGWHNPVHINGIWLIYNVFEIAGGPVSLRTARSIIDQIGWSVKMAAADRTTSTLDLLEKMRELGLVQVARKQYRLTTAGVSHANQSRIGSTLALAFAKVPSFEAPVMVPRDLTLGVTYRRSTWQENRTN